MRALVGIISFFSVVLLMVVMLIQERAKNRRKNMN